MNAGRGRGMHGPRVPPKTLGECLLAVRFRDHPAAGSPVRRTLLGATATTVRLTPPASPPPTREPSPHTRSEELARLEATLFLAKEPLPTRRLAKLARLPDGTRARTLLRELRTLQESEGSAMRVETIAGGYQIFTRAAFGPWVRRLCDHPAAGKISSAGLETLAIVAYRQPVTRAEIEAIRGVGSEEMLRQLLERDLVAVGGKAEELGRPNVYVTTRRFLAAFGLSRIEDMPPVEHLSPTPPTESVASPEAIPPTA